MCVQAKGPLAIVDKLVILNQTELCGFDPVGPQYTGPMTKNGSETVISKTLCGVALCSKPLFLTTTSLVSMSV